MSKLNFNFITLIFSFFISHAFTQENIVVGQKHKIHSDILNSNREYWISLPENYEKNPQKNYPVIYFFDGKHFFLNMVGLVDRLRYGFYASIPEVILVGITQEDRTNELTPTHINTPDNWKRTDFATSGGNSDFMKFVVDELKKTINQKYRTNGFDILAGHSFGGLATLNSWINSPKDFDAYIAIDPSLWWDNEYLIRRLDSLKNENYTQKNIIYIATATKNTSHKKNQVSTAKFLKKIKQNGLKSNIIKNKLYPNEDHGSVVVPGMYDALRFIFEGYQLSIKDAVQNPCIIKDHYQKISDRLGYQLSIEKEILEKLIDMSEKEGLKKQQNELKQMLEGFE